MVGKRKSLVVLCFRQPGSGLGIEGADDEGEENGEGG